MLINIFHKIYIDTSVFDKSYLQEDTTIFQEILGFKLFQETVSEIDPST